MRVHRITVAALAMALSVGVQAQATIVLPVPQLVAAVSEDSGGRDTTEVLGLPSWLTISSAEEPEPEFRFCEQCPLNLNYFIGSIPEPEVRKPEPPRATTTTTVVSDSPPAPETPPSTPPTTAIPEAASTPPPEPDPQGWPPVSGRFEPSLYVEPGECSDESWGGCGGWTPEREHHVHSAAVEFGLDPARLRQVFHCESGGNPYAVNQASTRAAGISQQHARYIAGRFSALGYDVRFSWNDSAASARVGAWLIATGGWGHYECA